jgi:hypothetical protein
MEQVLLVLVFGRGGISPVERLTGALIMLQVLVPERRNQPGLTLYWLKFSPDIRGEVTPPDHPEPGSN